MPSAAVLTEKPAREKYCSIAVEMLSSSSMIRSEVIGAGAGAAPVLSVERVEPVSPFFLFGIRRFSLEGEKAFRVAHKSVRCQ